jgi:hypothetical protein
VRLRRPCHEEKYTENCKRNEDVTDSLPAVTLADAMIVSPSKYCVCYLYLLLNSEHDREGHAHQAQS